MTFLASGATEASGVQVVAQGDPIPLHPIADTTQGVLKWSHGAFLYAHLRGQLLPTFYTLDRQGNVKASATPQIAGAAGRVWVNGFDRGADGSIAFAGGSVSSETQEVPFIVWISPDGQNSRIIRTAPYWPYVLAISPDGTIWTVGHEMINGNAKAPGLDPNAGVLRHYDTSGKLIASAGPRVKFTIDRLEHGFLVATNDRVGWYAPNYGHGNYVEVSVDTMTPHGYPGAPDPPPSSVPGMVESFALTDGGHAFLAFEDRNSHHRITYTF